MTFASYFMTDDQIGDAFFRGQTYPSDNTIPTDTNTQWKEDCMIQIYIALKLPLTTTVPTDTYGNYYSGFRWLFQRLINGESIQFAPNSPEERLLKHILKGSTRKTVAECNKYNDIYGKESVGD